MWTFAQKSVSVVHFFLYARGTRASGNPRPSAVARPQVSPSGAPTRKTGEGRIMLGDKAESTHGTSTNKDIPAPTRYGLLWRVCG